MDRSLVVIAHDIRSTHNVGSLLRTCEGLAVAHVYFTGYTPYPPLAHREQRLPHIAAKLGKQIHKTALGSEHMVAWSHVAEISDCIATLKQAGYTIAGLELTPDSIQLPEYEPAKKTALLLGREVDGIAPELLALCDDLVAIPMLGQKESFNVVQAAAMALYHFRFGK